MRNTQRGLAGNGRMEMVPGGSGDLQRCLFLFNGWQGRGGEVFKSDEISCIKKIRILEKTSVSLLGLRHRRRNFTGIFGTFLRLWGTIEKMV